MYLVSFVYHTLREGNQCVDWLAKFGANMARILSLGARGLLSFPTAS